MRSAWIIGLMAAASLAACEEKEPEFILVPNPPPSADDFEPGAGPGAFAGGGGGNTAAPAVAPTAADGSRPERKAGLWQLTTASSDGNSTATLCVGPTSEARVTVFDGGRGGARGGRGPGCEPRLAKTAQGWTSTTNCTVQMGENSMRISRTATVTGDLATRYTMKSRNSTSGGPQGDRTTEMTVTGEYKGACPSGQRPGDMTAGGNTFNVLEGGGGREGRGPGRGPGGGAGRQGRAAPGGG